MRLTEKQREQIENRIRAAADRLLAGELPPGGGCDFATLAKEAGVSRSALYSTYLHLKDDFERRRDRLVADGDHPDPREAQLVHLKKKIETLKERVSQQQDLISELQTFRSVAVSRLAAQHEEISRLRELLADKSKVALLSDTRLHRAPYPASEDR